ncbi:hypothetical protein ACMDXG_002658 [Enterococcus faecalis]
MHKAKVKTIPLKFSFSDVKTVSRSPLRFSLAPFRVSVPFTACYSTTASRKHKGKMHEQARPCVFLVSMVLSLHSKRHEHTGENEQSKTKRKGGESTPFDEKENLSVQLHFLKRLTKMVVQKPKPKA